MRITHVPKLGILASIAIHGIALSMLALTQPAQGLSGAKIIMVDMIRDMSSLARVEKGPAAAAKLKSSPVSKQRGASSAPNAAADQKKEWDIIAVRDMQVPEPSMPLSDASKTGLDRPPGIVQSDDAKNVTHATGTAESGHSAFISTTANGGLGRDSGDSGGDQTVVVETSFGAVDAPAFVHRELPVYPKLAERLGKEGRVILRLLIDPQGRLRNVEVIESSWMGFSEAAISAIRKSTFSPGRKDGELVFSKVLLPVRFNLK